MCNIYNISIESVKRLLIKFSISFYIDSQSDLVVYVISLYFTVYNPFSPLTGKDKFRNFYKPFL